MGSFLLVVSNGSLPTRSYFLLSKSFPCRKITQRTKGANKLLP